MSVVCTITPSVQVLDFELDSTLIPCNSLIYVFCSSDQRFASSFLQILPHDRHPCRSANCSPCKGQYRTLACCILFILPSPTCVMTYQSHCLMSRVAHILVRYQKQGFHELYFFSLISGFLLVLRNFKKLTLALVLLPIFFDY